MKKQVAVKHVVVREMIAKLANEEISPLQIVKNVSLF